MWITTPYTVHNSHLAHKIPPKIHHIHHFTLKTTSKTIINLHFLIKSDTILILHLHIINTTCNHLYNHLYTDLQLYHPHLYWSAADLLPVYSWSIISDPSRNTSHNLTISHHTITTTLPRFQIFTKITCYQTIKIVSSIIMQKTFVTIPDSIYNDYYHNI